MAKHNVNDVAAVVYAADDAGEADQVATVCATNDDDSGVVHGALA